MKLGSQKFLTLTGVGCLVLSAIGLSACDIRFDDGTTAGLKSIALDQVVRLHAASCSTNLANALQKNLAPAADSFAKTVSQNFLKRSEAFGPVWPVKGTGTDTTKTTTGSTGDSKPSETTDGKLKKSLPQPEIPVLTQPITDAAHLVQTWSWCAKQQLNDGYLLARVVATANLSDSSDLPEGTKELLHENDLAKVGQLALATWSAGYESQLELAEFLKLVPTNFTAVEPIKSAPLNLVNGKWTDAKIQESALAWTDLTKLPPPAKEALKTAAAKGTLGRDSQLGQIIRRGDYLRATLEELTARLGTVPQKTEQLEVYTPAIRRYLQHAVAHLGTDPREAAYSGELGIKTNSLAEAREEVAQQLFDLQYEILLADPQAAQLGILELLQTYRPLLSKLPTGGAPFPRLQVNTAQVEK